MEASLSRLSGKIDRQSYDMIAEIGHIVNSSNNFLTFSEYC